MRQLFLVLFLFIFLFSGCIQTQSRKEDAKPPTPVEVADNSDRIISLLGKVLADIPLSPDVRQKRENELLKARNNYEQDPDNLENIIWYGRRLAYLGQYREAIRIYSVGLDKYPDSYKLLRHRGHRFITLRKFKEAIEDLQRAAFYVRPYKNETEPDGIPNRLNKPLSNTKFNIWYHLGLAYYFKGNYDKAISSFKKCMEFCDNADLQVAATDWFYMTYRKIGNIQAAERLLIPINNRMTIIENMAYHQRLLMYKGIYNPEILLEKARQGMPEEALEPTLAYGVGNWYAYNGRINDAREILFRITVGPKWDSFGYIAAEVDLLALKDL